MVAQLQTPGQGMERPRYQTYEDKPNHIYVSGSYVNVNGGYQSYMGGIRYLYWSNGGTRVQIRNFATDDYSATQGGPTSGIFDFNYNRIVSLQVQLCSGTADLISGAANRRGAVAYVDLTNNWITLAFFTIIGGVKSAYTLTPTDVVHLELVLQRYDFEGEVM